MNGDWQHAALTNMSISSTVHTLGREIVKQIRDERQLPQESIELVRKAQQGSSAKLLEDCLGTSFVFALFREH